MIPLALIFINKLPAFIVGPAVAIAVLMGAVKYNQWFHDPAIRAAALKGYISQVELTSAQARVEEVLRQKNAGDAVVAELNVQLLTTQAARDAATQKLEQEIADHEKLSTACPLTNSNIDWLHN